MAAPLNGVRVIEMGQLIAIPSAMKMLADMGAEVIRVESCQRQESYRGSSLYHNDADGEFWNRGANFYEQNRNKLGVTLDLTRPEGLAALRDLVAISDVFAENFTPRVIKNFGLEYEDLKKLRPDIIMVSSTGYGYTGPWANFGATGPATEGAAGLAYLTGYRGGPPVMSEIPFTDYTAAEHTAFAVMAALMHRLHTGEGQFIDISQTQTCSATAPEGLLDFAVNGRVPPRAGNADPVMAPHGCYPCRGDDRWIVIAVSDNEQWRALCRALERPQWLEDSRFVDEASRREGRDALDSLIADATPQWDAHELMQALQQAGVPAGAALDSEDLLFDPHLRDRGFYEVVAHHPTTGMPPLPYPGRPWKLTGSPATPGKAAPILGEHNLWTLGELLGRSHTEIAGLEAKGIIGYAPTNPRSVRAPDPEEQVRQGRMQRYNPNYAEDVAREYGINQPPGA